MAAVTINIPGIGNIVADNAGTEETLQKILAAIQKQGLGGGAGAGKRKEDDVLKKAKEEEAKAADKTKDALAGLTKNTKDADDKAKTRERDLKERYQRFSDGMSQAGGAVVGGLSSLAKTAASVFTQMATSYDSFAASPIQAAKGLLSTAIDTGATAAKATSDVVTGFAGGLLGMIPFVGGGLTAAAEAANKLAKSLIDAAAQILKTANDVFAKEFQKSADALFGYAKAGASFAGGMTEMRTVANNASLSITTLQKASAAAAADIRMAGLTQADGAKMIARGMTGAVNTIGKSGMSLRDEMLSLGYSYEEQAQLVAQVSALDKAAGNTRKMSDEELAQSTRTYAKDLKVLADITGKDAKKAMEEAAQKSMQADIMAQLSPEEAKKFQAAYASMPDYAKKGFLEYVSSGGTAITDQATNIAMSQNAEVEKLIKGSYDTIKDSGKDASQAQKETLIQASAAGQAQRDLNKANGNAIAMANTLGGSLQSAADMQNKISSSALYNADAVEESGKTAEAQATTTDQTTQSFVKLTDQTNKFAIQMETLVGKNLDVYSKILADTMDATFKTMTKAITEIDKLIDTVRGKNKTGDNAPPPPASQVTTQQTAANAVAERSAAVLADPNSSKAQKEQAEADENSAAYAARQANLEAKNARRLANREANGMKKFAFGGISNEPAIFGEQGIEAAVPLPDGRTIPVSVSGSLTTAMNSLTEAISKLVNADQNKGNNPLDAIAKHMEEMKDTVAKQLDYHVTMADLMGEANNLSGSILNNSY